MKVPDRLGRVPVDFVRFDSFRKSLLYYLNHSISSPGASGNHRGTCGTFPEEMVLILCMYPCIIYLMASPVPPAPFISGIDLFQNWCSKIWCNVWYFGGYFKSYGNILSQQRSCGMLVFLGGGGGSRLRSRVILATFGVHVGDFKVIWGAKMKLKMILGHLKGSIAPQGASWEPKGAILVDLGFVLGSFGVPNWSHKSVLEHLLGPMAPQGCHFGRFWAHFGDIFEAKIMPTLMTKITVFSRVDVVFRGLQRRSAKQLDM